MSDMIRDVDDSLKKDKLDALWKEYGPTIIVSCIALIILTAVFAGYRSWKVGQDEAVTKSYIEALAAPNTQEALAEFIEDNSDGIGGLAYLAKGNLASEQGDTVQAIEAYKALSDNNGAHPWLQDLGTVLYAGIRLAQSTEEISDLDEMTDKLSDVVSNDDSPWQGYAVLFQGLSQKHLKGETEEAVKLLSSYESSESTPTILKSQIKALSDFYAQELN